MPDHEIDLSEWPDDAPRFTGDCTCEHDPGAHGWGCCEVGDCGCAAGWED